MIFINQETKKFLWCLRTIKYFTYELLCSHNTQPNRRRHCCRSARRPFLASRISQREYGVSVYEVGRRDRRAPGWLASSGFGNGSSLVGCPGILVLRRRTLMLKIAGNLFESSWCFCLILSSPFHLVPTYSHWHSLKNKKPLSSPNQLQYHTIPHICHERHEYIRVNFFWPV